MDYVQSRVESAHSCSVVFLLVKYVIYGVVYSLDSDIGDLPRSVSLSARVATFICC